MSAAHFAVIIALCLLAMAPAQARDQDLGELQRAVDAFVRARTVEAPGRVEINVPPLDPRTRLPACETFEPFLSPTQRLWGAGSVGVRCLHGASWTIYVPVTVRVVGEIVVTSRPIARGQNLSAADVRTQTTELTQLPVGVITDLAQAIGRTAVAAFPEGFALRTDMLRAPYAVTTGQSVRVVVQGAGFTVSAEGRALGNAAVGEPVQVRAASGRMLNGIVLEAGVVEVR